MQAMSKVLEMVAKKDVTGIFKSPVSDEVVCVTLCPLICFLIATMDHLRLLAALLLGCCYSSKVLGLVAKALPGTFIRP